MDFDYKKYSLENLENWLHDVISCGEASPHEIYSTIRKVVQEQHDIYKERQKNCLGLLELLSGHRPVDFELEDVLKEREYYEQSMQPWGHSDLEYMVQHSEDKVVRWQLPVEMDGLTGECYVQFPDDLLEAADLKEGDPVEWIDLGNGSFELRKVNGTV